MKNFINQNKVISLILLMGVIAVLVRLVGGLGAVSALSDAQPWGLTKSLNILSGAALSAGGSLVATLVYVFGIKKFKPLVRPSLLMGAIAHTFVLGALLYDVGSPLEVWRIIFAPNIKSIMFLAFLCEAFYTTAVLCEFVPEFVTAPQFKGIADLMHSFKGPVIVCTAIFAVIHQSTLGALYVVSVSRIDPLWYSRIMPILFLVSAWAAGLAMLVVEAYLSDKSGRRKFDVGVMGAVGNTLAIFLFIYVGIRFADLAIEGGFGGVGGKGVASVWFIVEMLCFVLPAVMLLGSKSPKLLYIASLLVGLGVVMNRLGVAIVGWHNPAGITYFPSAVEFFVSFCFLLAPIVIYSYMSGIVIKDEKVTA
ncbi:MAG TPA: NrfD/PsrC family molybdoenzyme membrane anchor subunit [Nitrospirota bacterium]